MKKIFTTTLVLLTSLAVVRADRVSAQEQGAEQRSTTNTVVKKVGFRMSNWRTIHGDDTKATQETVVTLQKIGCEVKESDHGGHVDIGYRCPNWKTISVDNDEQSRQWQQWLVKNEFETVVLNPAVSSKLPTVEVRLANWKTLHARNAEQAGVIRSTYELIGCEVAIEKHGDHIDAKIRCPNWMVIGLPNAQAAHVWQDWLKKSGFETRHHHAADGHDAHAGHDHN